MDHIHERKIKETEEDKVSLVSTLLVINNTFNSQAIFKSKSANSEDHPLVQFCMCVSGWVGGWV